MESVATSIVEPVKGKKNLEGGKYVNKFFILKLFENKAYLVFYSLIIIL